MDSPEEADLTTAFKLYGTFWFSTDSENTSVSGRLSYAPSTGLHLHLYEALPNADFIPFGSDKPRGPIWGILRGRAGQRVPVSLFDQIRTNLPSDGSSDVPPPGHEIYYINCAVSGLHALKASDISIKTLYLSFAGFESFVNIPVLGPVPDGTPDRFGIVYTEPTPITANLPDFGFEMSITSRYGWENRRFECSSKLTYRYLIELAAPSELPMTDAMSYAYTLTNFLRLCSSQPAVFRSVHGMCDNGTVITWFAKGHGQAKRPTLKDWLLRLEDLRKDRLGDILNAWFLISKKMGLMGHVFFGELQSPSTYGDARFFHLAGCLEALHRDVLQGAMGRHVPVADHMETVRSLMNHVDPNLPPILRANIESAIKHANDHFYAERLDHLFSSLEPETRSFLADDPARFLQTVKHSRNRLAHVDDDMDHKTFKSWEYHHANEKLQIWIMITLLREIGVSESMVRKRMSQCQFDYPGPFRFDEPEELVGCALQG